MNDGSVSDYYHIEGEARIHAVKRGKSLLPTRNVVYHYRKAANRLAMGRNIRLLVFPHELGVHIEVGVDSPFQLFGGSTICH